MSRVQWEENEISFYLFILTFVIVSLIYYYVHFKMNWYFCDTSKNSQNSIAWSVRRNHSKHRHVSFPFSYYKYDGNSFR